MFMQVLSQAESHEGVVAIIECTIQNEARLAKEAGWIMKKTNQYI